jgi:hypothetical protein
VEHGKKYALRLGPMLEGDLMNATEDVVPTKSAKLLKVLYLMVHAYKDAFDLPNLIVHSCHLH